MKVKPNAHEMKAIIRSFAILQYLKDEFYEKYPKGVPELIGFEKLLDLKDETLSKCSDDSAKLLVDEAVSDLIWILEKYNVS